MAVIYIDNFESTLEGDHDSTTTTLSLPSPDMARLITALGYAPYVPQSQVGPRHVRLPLYIDNGSYTERVYVTHSQFGGAVLAMERTAGLAFAHGAAVRPLLTL